MAVTLTKNIIVHSLQHVRTDPNVYRTHAKPVMRVQIHACLYVTQVPPTQRENNSLLLLPFRRMLQHLRIERKRIRSTSTLNENFHSFRNRNNFELSIFQSFVKSHHFEIFNNFNEELNFVNRIILLLLSRLVFYKDLYCKKTDFYYDLLIIFFFFFFHDFLCTFVCAVSDSRKKKLIFYRCKNTSLLVFSLNLKKFNRRLNVIIYCRDNIKLFIDVQMKIT